MIEVKLVQSSEAVAAGNPLCPECGVENFDTTEWIVLIAANYYHATCAIRVGKRILRRAEDAEEQFPLTN